MASEQQQRDVLTADEAAEALADRPTLTSAAAPVSERQACPQCDGTGVEEFAEGSFTECQVCDGAKVVAAPASEARIAEAVRWCDTADDDCQCGECKAKRELRAILTGRAAKASD
jgi:hypothetical protein